MPAAVLLAQIILPLLPQITGDISSLIAWIQSLRSAAQQAGVWTAEAETAWRNSILSAATDPEQQPDVGKPAVNPPPPVTPALEVLPVVPVVPPQITPPQGSNPKTVTDVTDAPSLPAGSIVAPGTVSNTPPAVDLVGAHPDSKPAIIGTRPRYS